MRKAAVILAGFVLLGGASAGAEEILIRKDGKLVPVTVQDVKESDFVFAGTPTLVWSVPLGSAGRTQSAPPGPLAANPNSFYSNVTTFSGSGFANGGATNLAGNTITQLVADDLTFTATPLHPGDPFTVIRFGCANLNGVAVSARPRLRFYQDNAGAPGTLITGFTFNPISFPAGSVTIFNFNPALTIAAGSKIWAGMTFDDNTGGTGATLAQMNLLGQGIFGPPDVGTSADVIFITNTAGDFLVNNPAGTTNNFGVGNPLANLGWEFATPVELQSFTAE